MQINEIKAKLNSNEYSFLKTDKRLGSNVILLTAGGSHAYGTDTENSDLDIRGCAANSRMGILASGSFRQFTNMDELIGEDFEQFTDNATDTVIYSINSYSCLQTAIRILLKCLDAGLNIIFIYQTLAGN